jgi:hypothetical protein
MRRLWRRFWRWLDRRYMADAKTGVIVTIRARDPLYWLWLEWPNRWRP